MEVKDKDKDFYYQQNLGQALSELKQKAVLWLVQLLLYMIFGIDPEKPHGEVYQCQCLEYIMLFVADKTHVTATNNMKENTKERIEYYITIFWESLLALFHLLATSCDPLYNYLLEILSWHCFISWRRHESAPFIFTAILCFMFLLFLYLYLYLYF